MELCPTIQNHEWYYCENNNHTCSYHCGKCGAHTDSDGLSVTRGVKMVRYECLFNKTQFEDPRIVALVEDKQLGKELYDDFLFFKPIGN